MTLANGRRYWGHRQSADFNGRKVFAAGCAFTPRTLGVSQAFFSGRQVFAGGTCTDVGDMNRVPGILQHGNYNGRPVYAVACCPAASSGSRSGSGSGPSGSGLPTSLSGSGSGVGTLTDDCDFCPDGAPAVWEIEAVGFAAGTGGGSGPCDDCPDMDGLYYVTHLTFCLWGGEEFSFCTNVGSGTFSWSLQMSGPNPGQVTVYVTISGEGNHYQNANTWDCLGPNLMTKVVTAERHCIIPDTIIVRPA